MRVAKVADVEAVADLTKRAFEPWVSVVGSRPAPLDADHQALIVNGSVFLAESNGCIDGAIVLIPSPDALIIESVAVRPERQRRGVGRRLITFAECTAREHCLPAVRLFTHARMINNIELYLHLGYTIIGTQPIRGGHLVHLRKALHGGTPCAT